jgi:hypothetical protein
MKRCARSAILMFALALLAGAAASAEPWRFGVMSDTQWKANTDGQNPGTVAVGIINQLNKQFIDHDVKFVIQVGDLVDKETNSPNGLPNERTMGTRAVAAQALYDAGIGFFPVRGNHEASQLAAAEFQALYPQTIGGGGQVFGAKNFSSPFADLNGLSYSFDYKDARFVLLDQFTRTDGASNLGSADNNILDQQGWIDTQLSTRGRQTHAFVFSHKNLIGGNHTDILFGANPAANPVGQNAFYSSLQNHGVRYQFGGHDHMHHRSIITSPDSNASLQEIIASSNSYKFYIPLTGTNINDIKYNNPPREIPIAEELFTIGYYIVTVDGPRVTVDHYASPNGCGGDCDLTATPNLTFSKRETFGYSLNGQEFLIPQGHSYTDVRDSFDGTTAKILCCANSSTAKLYDGRPTTKAVNTGWAHKEEEHRWGHGHDRDLASNILSLWGMADLGTDQTDTYVLSMTYDTLWGHLRDLLRGEFGLAVRNEHGKWINAVDANVGGTKRFVLGPWRPHYTLGTYGVDLFMRTAWAVVNHTGDFAAAEDLDWGPRK